MSRGGREGNNALTKDDGPSNSLISGNSIAEFIMAEPNVTPSVVEQLIKLKVLRLITYLSILR